VFERFVSKIRQAVRIPGGTYPARQIEGAKVRRALAAKYLDGTGIEVGALHSPLWVPARASVRYVDRLSVEDLRRHYPELSQLPLVNVDIIDNGETLESIPVASQDFLIANHFLEHTQDPIGTLKRHLSVLRQGGILYLAVPDKRWTFDANRPETTLQHLIADHDHGPQISYDAHIREYAELVDGLSGEELESRIGHLKATRYSIHFHVWTDASFRELLDHMRGPAGLRFELLDFQTNRAREENIAIIRKA
jgi:DNA-binding transcriptional ArsR family regulator